jgi:hypothetical protein
MSCHQVEILNYNHSIVELSKGNTLVVTDNNACNSVTIPQATTCILQVNSPGPQGPGGFPFKGNAVITGSLLISGSGLTVVGNQIITGSIIFNEGARITSTYYGNTYPGYIDIVAGAPGGFVELLSYNQSSSVNVDDYSVYITTQSGSLFNLWEFKNSGRLVAPRGIEAPSFTGSLQGTSSYALTASYVTASNIRGTVTSASYALNGLSGGINNFIPLWSGSNTLISSFLNQSGSILKTTSASVNTGLKLDFVNKTYQLGDYTESNNGVTLNVNDNTQRITADKINAFDFNVRSSTRNGVYISNANYFTSDEAGLYDAGGDAPIAVYVNEVGGYQTYRYSPFIKVNQDGGLTSIAAGLEITGSLKQNGYEVKPYKVYIALLNQTGGSNPTVNNNSMQDALVIGQSYFISVNDNLEGDFTNVGATSNAVGTYFVATGTNPAAWGSNTVLNYNTGAPVATVLENTIGLLWWEIRGDNTFRLRAPGQNLNTAYISSYSYYNIDNDTSIIFSVSPPSLSGASADFTSRNITNGTNDTDALINTPIEIRIYN